MIEHRKLLLDNLYYLVYEKHLKFISNIELFVYYDLCQDIYSKYLPKNVLTPDTSYLFGPIHRYFSDRLSKSPKYPYETMASEKV